METIEYLLFMASCIGFWLGFSFISFLLQARALFDILFQNFVCGLGDDCKRGSRNDLQGRVHSYHDQGNSSHDDGHEILRKKDLEKVIEKILFKIRFDLFRQLNERNHHIYKIVLEMIEKKQRRELRL